MIPPEAANMKENIRLVIQDLQCACQQSLYNGIAGVNDAAAAARRSPNPDPSPVVSHPQSVTHPQPKRQRRYDSSSIIQGPRSWDVVLAEASRLLPLMTNHEHGQVSRLTGILLLGFFLPHSTGNHFFSLQNLSTQNRVQITGTQQRQSQPTGLHTSELTATESSLSERQILAMPLEERLESSAHRYGNEFGELEDLIVHESVDNAFWSFLNTGLRPFLSGRPAHATQVDLIHLLAMAIHPHPSEQCIRQTTSRLEEQKSHIWETTTRLMSSLVGHSFHVNYRHRVELVRTVLDCLVLPECQQEAGTYTNSPLFEGAIPHLRASLYAFGMAAMSPYDSHLAQCAMVMLAIQSGIDHVVKEEWSRLLHRMVDDRTNYGRSLAGNDKSTASDTLGLAGFSADTKFCPHTARGELLRTFLIRYNEARGFSDEEFLQYALGSLTDAIEMQVDCWSKVEEPESEEQEKDQNDPVVGEGDNNDESSNQPPLVLASLLNAAKNLFHFLLPVKNNLQSTREGDDEDEEEQVEESEDSHRRDMLISCAIQLVHHWDPVIAKEACTLLILAFSYSKDILEDFMGAVYDSVVLAVDISIKKKDAFVVPIEGLVSVFSHRSLAFAVNLCRLLLTEGESGDENALVVFPLIAAIANARPAVAQQHIDTLKHRLEKVKDPTAKKHILASILSCRKTHYFANEHDAPAAIISKISDASLGNWDKYLLSRHAILTGNFAVANKLLNELMVSAPSETSFLWLSAMEKVAEGEAKLCSDAAKTLQEAASMFRTAIGTFRSLEALGLASTSFQIRLLELRVSFLDLLTSMRQLTMEMRLIGTEPKKFTRPRLHLQNIIRLLRRLSMDYLRLYKEYGLFICQQSRSVLRTLHALCFFVAKAASRIFVDSISVDEDKSDKVCVDGDSSQPITSMMKQLDTFALGKVNKFVDAKIRAVTLLQIMDGILKTPAPIPRSLAHPKRLPRVSLRLERDPDTHDGEENPLKLHLGATAAFLASGTIPSSLISISQIPFNVVLLWYTLTFKSSFTTASTGSKNLQNTESGPIAASISSGGSFFTKIETDIFVDEGWYDLNFRLGCRDIRGGVWELPVKHSHSFAVKVARSRRIES